MKTVIIYLASILIVTVVFIYGLHLPNVIVGKTDLIHEWYYTNALSSFVSDIFIITAYIQIGLWVASMFQTRYLCRGVSDIMGLIFVTCVLGVFFMLLFYNGAKYNYISRSSFFVRWFGNVGPIVIFYDIILVLLVYGMIQGLDYIIK
jgi:hypothetical protein